GTRAATSVIPESTAFPRETLGVMFRTVKGAYPHRPKAPTLKFQSDRPSGTTRSTPLAEFLMRFTPNVSNEEQDEPASSAPCGTFPRCQQHHRVVGSPVRLQHRLFQFRALQPGGRTRPV